MKRLLIFLSLALWVTMLVAAWEFGKWITPWFLPYWNGHLRDCLIALFLFFTIKAAIEALEKHERAD